MCGATDSVSDLAFTDYVRGCLASSVPDSADGGDCDRLCGGALEKLRSALIHELRRRFLWLSPPNYLGILGCTSWSDRCLDELLYECHGFIFFDRRQSLVAQLKVKPNIEGLVFLSLKNFLYDQQKKHDRLGFQVFTVLAVAIRQATRAGNLHVLRGSGRVRNDTVVGFEPDSNPDDATDAGLGGLAGEWADELLPEVVTAGGARLERVAGRLVRLLASLPARGIEVFRFKAVVDPLKQEVRSRWAAFLEGPSAVALRDRPDDLPDLRQVLPDVAVSEREHFEKLTARVEDALDQHTGREARELRAIWRFLEPYWSGDDGDKPPSRREVARRLGISRGRLPRLLNTMRRLVEDCRAAIAGEQGFESTGVTP